MSSCRLHALQDALEYSCRCVHIEAFGRMQSWCRMQTRAVALLSRVAVLCDDDTRLQRVVPYILVCHPVHPQPELRFLISR